MYHQQDLEKLTISLLTRRVLADLSDKVGYGILTYVTEESLSPNGLGIRKR